jgi:hypothetical protein
MPDTFTLYGDAKQVGRGGDELQRIGVSGATVYYAGDDEVSARDFAIEDGEEIVTRGAVWMVSAQSTKVTVTPINAPPPEEDDAEPVDVAPSEAAEERIKDEEKQQKEQEKADKEAEKEKSSSSSSSSSGSK